TVDRLKAIVDLLRILVETVQRGLGIVGQGVSILLIEAQIEAGRDICDRRNIGRHGRR
ncbi:MAG: hypothetical protein Q613_PSC00264G0001, partial [Propionibacterium sp. DORA_15]